MSGLAILQQPQPPLKFSCQILGLTIVAAILVGELIEISVPSELNKSPPMIFDKMIRGTYRALKRNGGTCLSGSFVVEILVLITLPQEI